jgi:hypothetical protein
MKRIIAILITLSLTIAGVAACGGTEDPVDEYREAVPTHSQLAVTVPESSGTSSEPGKLTQALLGQRADLYELTYKVSHEVNGGIWVGLNIIESILQHPPTLIQNGVVTWGPYTPPLEPLTWMLNVTKKGPGQFAYALSARKKADKSGTFSVILAGTSTKGYSKYFSGYKGVYTANASNLNALDPATYPDTGKMVATYDTTGIRRKVQMALKDYSEAGGPKGDALYSYLDRVDASGEFGFVARTDLQKDGSADEVFAVKSAWNDTGAGLGFATVSGGDLPSGVVIKVTECWDDSFARTFYKDNGKVNPDEGDPSNCVL